VRELPAAARLFVAATISCAGIVLVLHLPVHMPDVRVFAVLAFTSVVTSGLKLRLPLGTSAANLSVSYTVDFASLLLLGTGPTLLLSALSACIQSTVRAARRNPPHRVAFNIAAVILTVSAAGFVFTVSGGQVRALDVASLAKPLVVSVLVYYLFSTAIIATIVALASGQRLWHTWHGSFLWTAPSYFVGAISAAAGAMLFLNGHVWLVPLAAAPVYLTFRSYRIYIDRIAAEQRHKEEVQRLHDEAVEALRAAQESEERYAMAAAGSNDGLWDWNIVTGVFYCSGRWKLMLGLRVDTAVERFEDWCRYVHEDDLGSFRTALEQHLAGDSPHFQQEYRMRHVDDDFLWVLCRGVAVRDEAGRPIRMSGSQTDITDRRRIQMALAHAAAHDALTGLPNRTMLTELLENALARTHHTDHRFAVLFVDLDRFKYVNDSLGHLAGDRFLIGVSERLKSNIRPCDVLARLGGDEFAVLVDTTTEPAAASSIAERLQQALREPFRIDGREIYASASIGIASSSTEYLTADDLLRAADTAMYRAKGTGRGRYQEFDPQMHASAMDRLMLEMELRRAIARGEFVLHYQPIVALDADEISGFEALVRWARADGRIVGPADFIPVAEETGLIAPLTQWVLGESCRQVAEWQQTFRRPLTMTVNISTKMFDRQALVDDVRKVVMENRMVPGTLRLEITESALMDDADTTEQQLAALRRMQVQLYLDDFGTGYSSLSYLQRYQLDALKIDRSFVRQIGTTPGGTPILRIIVNLAKELGMEVIAEGVETAEQARRLSELQCMQAQGFLFSPPLTATAAHDLLGRMAKNHRTVEDSRLHSTYAWAHE
jgi:diguanylate cyclase (GGDEF)-like protein/PAS domain S-box-containing protein